MNLDRYKSPTGTGKYGIVKLRVLRDLRQARAHYETRIKETAALIALNEAGGLSLIRAAHADDSKGVLVEITLPGPQNEAAKAERRDQLVRELRDHERSLADTVTHIAEFETALGTLRAMAAYEDGTRTENGTTKSDPEAQFFVIRLRDMFAVPALRAYTRAVCEHILTVFNAAVAPATSTAPTAGKDRAILLGDQVGELTQYAVDLNYLTEEAAAVAQKSPKVKIPD